MANTVSINQSGWLSNVEAWINQPFNPKMSLWDWILFIVVIGSVAGLWYMLMESFRRSS